MSFPSFKKYVIEIASLCLAPLLLSFACLSLSCFLISSRFFLLPFPLFLPPPFPSPLSATRKIWEEKSDTYTCLPWCLTQTPRLPIYSLLYAEELAQTRQLWSCKLKAWMITLEQHECSRGWHFHSIAWLNTAVLLKQNHNFFSVWVISLM